MTRNQPLPALWLLSDERNDPGLENALARLPRGSGFVFRHYHLNPDARTARFAALARIARGRGHVLILAGSAETARAWGADGIYGAPHSLGRGRGLMRLATVHSLREIARANRACADAALLSPVFPTRSHPGAPVLGAVRFHLLATRLTMPVIALGGMDRAAARRLGCDRWAAIDGLS